MNCNKNSSNINKTQTSHRRSQVLFLISNQALLTLPMLYAPRASRDFLHLSVAASPQPRHPWRQPVPLRALTILTTFVAAERVRKLKELCGRESGWKRAGLLVRLPCERLSVALPSCVRTGGHETPFSFLTRTRGQAGGWPQPNFYNFHEP